MKLKQILPISLLAVLSLAGCDSNGDSSSSSSEEQQGSQMKQLYDSLAVGAVSEENVAAIWENIDDALVGVTGSESSEIVGVDARLYSQATAEVRMANSGYKSYDYSAKMYDNDVIEVNLLSQENPYLLNEDQTDLADPLTLAGWSDAYTEDISIWADSNQAHLALIKNGDPADESSFVKSVPAADVNLADYAASFDGSLIAEYKAFADYALSELASDFVESSIVSYAEKVAAVPAIGETEAVPEHLEVNYFFLGSWFGLYSLENVWEDSEYAGVYLNRGETYGVSLNISSEGLLISSDLYFDQLIDTYYVDNNWVSGDPVPSDPLTAEEIAGLDLVRDEVDYSSLVMGLTQTVYSTAANGDFVLADLPDIAALREVNDFDTTYFFDPVDFGA
ncbi:MAG: hypothetical protein WC282_01505 [Bacilli bacterium]|jgi:hypothetical protein